MLMLLTPDTFFGFPQLSSKLLVLMMPEENRRPWCRYEPTFRRDLCRMVFNIWKKTCKNMVPSRLTPSWQILQVSTWDQPLADHFQLIFKSSVLFKSLLEGLWPSVAPAIGTAPHFLKSPKALPAGYLGAFQKTKQVYNPCKSCAKRW